MRRAAHDFTVAEIEEGCEYAKRLENGRWYGRITYRTEDGKRREVGRTFPASVTTKAKARRAVSAWRHDLIEEARRREEAVASPSWTVADYVSHVIDESPADDSTKSKYRSLLTRIRAAFDGVALGDLTADMVADWQDGMEREGLAPTTITHYHALLSQAMRYAVEEEEILDRNPCKKKAARPPRRRHSEPNALGAMERGRLLDFLETAAYRPVRLAAYIAMLAGMRRGEICGLRWGDVDLERGIIHVRNSIGVKSGGTFEKEPKTGASIRDIPMPPQLISALKARRADMWEERIGLAKTTPEEFAGLYVIGRVDGSYYHPGILSRDWSSLADHLDLMGTQGRRPTFHDLRHTFITASVTEVKADIKTVASMAGHSKVSHTLDIYASADPDAKARLASGYGEAMAAERDAARARREEEEREREKRGQVLQMGTGTEG